MAGGSPGLCVLRPGMHAVEDAKPALLAMEAPQLQQPQEHQVTSLHLATPVSCKPHI